jgi:hypothetical protein
MIGALPDAGSRDDSESPTAWYRRTRGMTPGEKPDKPMRQALIGEYMAVEGTSLPDGISVVTHGCGENFPADPTPDGVADPDNRRVEVFFFDGVLGVQPPPGDNSAPGSPEYPEWVKRAKQTHDHEVVTHDVVLRIWIQDLGTDPDAAQSITLSADNGPSFPGSDALEMDGALVFEIDPAALPNPCQLLLSRDGVSTLFGQAFDPEVLRQALLASDLAASDVVFGPPQPGDADPIPAPEGESSYPV